MTAGLPGSSPDLAEPPHSPSPDGEQPAPSALAARTGPRLRTFQTIAEVPAFRWYMLSMVGNWSAMQILQVSRGFLTYELTDSFTALGVVELANFFPRLIFGLTGGVVADRNNRRTVSQVSQAVNAGIAATLAALLFMGLLTFPQLVAAAILQGIVNSFALPARQAMIPDIVGRERLSNAFALNVSLMSTLRLGAPMFAGVILATAGASWAFATVTICYLFSVIALFRVQLAYAEPRANVAPVAGQSQRSRAIRDITEVLSYTWRTPVLRMLVITDMFLGMLMFPYQRLLPGFVTEILADSEDQAAFRMGLLLSVTAVGALIGSLLIASLPERNRGKLVIASTALFGTFLLLFSVSTVFYVSMGIVLIMGIGQAGRQSLNNILIQSHVSNDYRGRVSSIMLFADGIESLGIFSIALLASAVGPQMALGTVALILIGLAGVMWAAMPSYRRVQ